MRYLWNWDRILFLLGAYSERALELGPKNSFYLKFIIGCLWNWDQNTLSVWCLVYGIIRNEDLNIWSLYIWLRLWMGT